MVVKPSDESKQVLWSLHTSFRLQRIVMMMMMVVVFMVMKVIIIMMIMIVVMIIIMRWSLHIHPLGLIHKIDNYHDKTLATSRKFKNCHIKRCWIVFKIIKVNL